MLLGPSESLIIADDSADPALLAADLLNEAEHGPDSSSVLVTDSEPLLGAVQLHVAEQLAALPWPRRPRWPTPTRPSTCRSRCGTRTR
jgi:histidinol dehydrogenase